MIFEAVAPSGGSNLKKTGRLKCTQALPLSDNKVEASPLQ